MIAIPLAANRVRGWLPKRKKEAHKGDAGRVYIIAGSRGMAGAGILAAMGAVRAGAGLVRLATVQSQQPVAAKRAPLEVMTEALPEDKNGSLSRQAWPVIRRTIEKFKPHVLAIGPGLSQTASVQYIVLKLISRTALPIVLDADGLNTLSREKKWSRPPSAPLIMTPHHGELARLLGVPLNTIKGDRLGKAAQTARQFHGICLLKGAKTIVTDGRKAFLNTTGNPAMASGGMGDALTGIISGLWGQLSPQNEGSALIAAALGAYVHGLAGDLAARKIGGLSILASDLVGFVPNALRALLRGGRGH